MFAALRESVKYLTAKDKAFLSLLVFSRVITNLFDVLGLVALGLLGTMVLSGLREGNSASFFGIDVVIASNVTYFWVIVLVGFFFVAKSFFAVVIGRISALFLARIEARKAAEVASRIYSEGLGRLQNFSRGDIHFAATSSVASATSGILTLGSTMVTEGTLFIAILVTFFLVDPWTALILSLYFLFVAVVFQLAIHRRLGRLGKRLGESAVAVTDSLQDLTSSFREIAVLDKRRFFLGTLSRQRTRLAQDSALATFYSGLPRLFVEAALMVGVMTLVGWQFLIGNLEDGLVVTIVFLGGGVRLMGAMLPVQTALTNAQSLVPLGKLAREILAPPVVTERNDRLLEKYSSAGQHGGDEGQGFDISLANVSFSHAGTVEKAIVDVSMHVDAGSFVALIGPSGAGKTTLADLILGLRTPSSGEVAVRGQPPSEKRKTAPGSISYVPQSPGMVTGSIAENVALGVSRDSIDRDQVWKVIRQAQLADFVDSLPFGIDSDFGRQSEALSAGQKQRMGLARALYSNPRLLVLDEATSALDALTESGISETIASLGQETTVIVIAHRLSTIQQADVVFVVEGGRITARGGFNEVRAEVPLIEEYVRLMSFE